MSAFIEWMGSDFLFVASAFVLAGRFLAPNGVRKRVLKSLRGPDRSRALKGIRNAAWDMALISEWGKKVEKENAAGRFWLLASADRALGEMARGLFVPAAKATDVDGFLLGELVATWGKAAGHRLYAKYNDHVHRPPNSRRKRAQSKNDADEMRRELEDQICRRGAA